MNTWVNTGTVPLFASANRGTVPVFTHSHPAVSRGTPLALSIEKSVEARKND